jgi:hypothetical protein
MVRLAHNVRRVKVDEVGVIPDKLRWYRVYNALGEFLLFGGFLMFGGYDLP